MNDLRVIGIFVTLVAMAVIINEKLILGALFSSPAIAVLIFLTAMLLAFFSPTATEERRSRD